MSVELRAGRRSNITVFVTLEVESLRRRQVYGFQAKEPSGRRSLFVPRMVGLGWTA
jgi:hypothetical protein